jgi:hypothetical protein
MLMNVGLWHFAAVRATAIVAAQHALSLELEQRVGGDVGELCHVGG